MTSRTTLKRASWSRRTVNPSCDPLIVWLIMFAQGERISLEALADQIGLSRQSLYTWMRGDHTPSVATLRAAVNALGYDLTITKRRELTEIYRRQG